MAPLGGECPPKREDGVEVPDLGGVDEVKEGKGECVPVLCLEGMALAGGRAG